MRKPDKTHIENANKARFIVALGITLHNSRASMHHAVKGGVSGR